MRALLLLLAVSFAADVAAQKVLPMPAARSAAAGVCETGTARAELNIAGVRAALYDTGQLFWNGPEYLYEVPKGSSTQAVFSTGLWVGGLVDDEVRSAGSSYGFDYRPGPLDADGTTTAPQCAAFDRIWTVTTADLDTYAATGTATADLAEWPVAVGAPYYVDLDGDGRQGEDEPTVSLDLGDAGYGTKTLDLGAGERPVIFGRQTAWWVMNDVDGVVGWPSSPLGIEIQVTAWLLGDPDAPDLVQSSFFSYKVINRNDLPIEDAYAGFYVDADLGNFSDDVVHSDSTRSMLVFYNSDEVDEGPYGYGVPPALGIDVLSGGWAAVNVTNSGSSTNHPETAMEVYRFLQGKWADGTPQTIGGYGYNPGGIPSRWTFPGDPVTGAYWSAEDSDGEGHRISYLPYAMVSARLGTLAPGEHRTLDLGILFAQGEDRLDSVADLRAVSEQAQARYDAGMLAALVEEPPPPAGVPVLLAPEDGADFPEGPVTFQWSPVATATAYTLEIDADPAFSAPFRAFVDGTNHVEVPADSLPANTLDPVYWRVQAETLGVQGDVSEAGSFTAYRYVATIASFEVVANAAGPLASPEPGAAAFAGFPTPGGTDPSAAQQTNGTRWLLSTGGRSTYEAFLDRVLRNDNASRISGLDFEMRFTGQSLAYRGFQDGATFTVPFELWSLGGDSPEDPSDDVRLIPIILDNDDDLTYNLSTLDSPLSDGNDDPETDWIYWYLPTDTSPGEAGYQAWEASASTDPTAGLGEELLARTTLVGWDLGTAPPYAADLPEPGTVFRIVVNDRLQPVATSDGPTRATPSLTVGPNPVRTRASVTYRTEVAGAVRLLLVDVLGREVAVLADGPRTAGEHRAEVDAAGLAAGVYVVVLDAGYQRVTRTITVVR